MKLSRFECPGDNTTREDIDKALEAVQEDLQDASPGDHSYYVVGDRFIYATVLADHNLHVYVGTIQLSTEPPLGESSPLLH